MRWCGRRHSRLLYHVFSTPTTVIGDNEAVSRSTVFGSTCEASLREWAGWLKETLFMTLTGTTPTPQTSPGWKHEPECIYLFSSFLLPIKNCISQFFLFSNHVTQLTKILFLPHTIEFFLNIAVNSLSLNVRFYILHFIFNFICMALLIFFSVFFFFLKCYVVLFFWGHIFTFDK